MTRDLTCAATVAAAVIATAALMLPLDGIAQTTTTCNGLGGMVTCNTSSPPPLIDYGAFARQQTQQQQQLQQDLQRTLATLRRRQIGRLVADGQCDQARDTALRQGDFELAQQASSMCEAQMAQRRAAVDAQVEAAERQVHFYLDRNDCRGAVEAAQQLGINRQIEVERGCQAAAIPARPTPAFSPQPAAQLADAAPAAELKQSSATSAQRLAAPPLERPAVARRSVGAPSKACIRVVTDPSQNSC